MARLDSVIAELEEARREATQRFAAQANMPVSAFLRHFRVVMQSYPGEAQVLSFRVEPRE
jgi:hypothetical protein